MTTVPISDKSKKTVEQVGESPLYKEKWTTCWQHTRAPCLPTDSLALPVKEAARAVERVFEQHRDGHGPHTTRHGRDGTCTQHTAHTQAQVGNAWRQCTHTLLHEAPTAFFNFEERLRRTKIPWARQHIQTTGASLDLHFSTADHGYPRPTHPTRTCDALALLECAVTHKPASDGGRASTRRGRQRLAEAGGLVGGRCRKVRPECWVP